MSTSRSASLAIALLRRHAETVDGVDGLEMPGSDADEMRIKIIAQLDRLRDGTRRVTAVTEVVGMEGQIVTLQDIYLFDYAAGHDVNGRFLGVPVATGVRPNELVLTLQPNEGVSLSLAAKIPGTGMRIRPVQMEFLYGTTFLSQSPEAYERLIMDAMRGDPTLFTRDDEVEAQWRIIDPILESWEKDEPPVFEYPAGSHGPEEADSILMPGHRWRAI